MSSEARHGDNMTSLLDGTLPITETGRGIENIPTCGFRPRNKRPFQPKGGHPQATYYWPGPRRYLYLGRALDRAQGVQTSEVRLDRGFVTKPIVTNSARKGLARGSRVGFAMHARTVTAGTRPRPVFGQRGPELRIPARPPSPNREVLQVRGPTPIRIDRLEARLLGYRPGRLAHFLLEGFKRGFRIPYQGSRKAYFSKNLQSVVGKSDIVRKKIAREVAEGRVVGPFSTPPLPTLRVSPLGVVPKRTPDEYRLIHHLSFPPGDSVNDFIPESLCSVRYTSFDQAVQMVRDCGSGALMGKCDIKSAFRLLPIHPEDFDLLGFSFEGKYFVDRALPMGCAISCALFERFSSFLEWAHSRNGGGLTVVHYLDDFLFAGPGGTSACSENMRRFQELCQDLGVPLAPEKTEGPTTKLTFLGIEIDSVAQSCCLPGDKLDRLRTAIRGASAARRASLRQLQELAGLLNFACRVVAPGRAFMFRIYKAMTGLTKPYHRTRLPAGLRKDLHIWQGFLDAYNGVSFWRQELFLREDFQIKSDAAGTIGFGVIWNNRWFSAEWPREWRRSSVSRDLTFLELFPIVVAVELWKEDFFDKTIHFWCDNMAVVHVVNTLSSRNERVMGLVRHLVLTCLRHNMLFRAHHVPGVDNGVADALSRGDMPRFRLLAPQARRHPEAAPAQMWQLGRMT